MKRNKLAIATIAPAALGTLCLAGCGQQPAQQTPATGTPVATTTVNQTVPTQATDEYGGPATKLEFSAQGSPNRISTNTTSEWALQVMDAKSGQPVTAFEKSHDRLMHLVVVSKDLSYFNHLHPQYKGKGIFTLKTSLKGVGQYKLYADYKPVGREQEVTQYEIAADPAPGNPAATVKTLPDAATLTPATPKAGWLIERVFAHAEGDPTSTKTIYEVALMPMPSKLVMGQEAMLHFQVRDANGKPVKDLQPYLGGMGHCVVISSDTTTFLHTHPQSTSGEQGSGDHSDHTAKPKSGGPDVMFHVTFPRDGLYKVWGEFMHKGKIITAPFVVEVSAGQAAAGQAGAADEHAGHGH